MTIDWTTEVEDLVNVDTVTGYVEDTEDQLKTWINPRIDTLELEMRVGGLSKEALIFNEESPLFDEASRIRTEFKDKLEQIADLKNDVEGETKEQRKTELTTLKTKVEEKLSDLNREKQKWENLAAQAKENGGKISYSYSQYGGGTTYTEQDCNDKATANDETIKTLNDKLERINTELGKL